MITRVIVTVKDTMAFWNDDFGAFLYDPDGDSHTNTFTYEVPEAWVANGALTAEGYARVFEHLYGASWRSGNGDGSKYEVLAKSSELAPPGDPRTFTPIG